MAHREGGVKSCKARPKLLTSTFVVEPIAKSLGKIGGSRLILQKLGDDKLPGKDVGKPRVGQ